MHFGETVRLAVQHIDLSGGQTAGFHFVAPPPVGQRPGVIAMQNLRRRYGSDHAAGSQLLQRRFKHSQRSQSGILQLAKSRLQRNPVYPGHLDDLVIIRHQLDLHVGPFDDMALPGHERSRNQPNDNQRNQYPVISKNEQVSFHPYRAEYSVIVGINRDDSRLGDDFAHGDFERQFCQIQQRNLGK